MLRDGVAVGQVTSAAYGATLGAGVGLAYVWCRDDSAVTPDYLNSGQYELNIGGAIKSARVSLRPLYDPESDKIRR